MNKKKSSRRAYQTDPNDIQLPVKYTGFTNHILTQEFSERNQVNFFLPIYMTMKIKSIKGIDVQQLEGHINAVITISLLIEELSEPIIYLLTHAIEIQINRSERLLLRADKGSQENIKMQRTSKMLKFIIRKTLSTTIDQEIFWSPFEIIRLVVSITFNSINKQKGQKILSSYLTYKQEQEEQKIKMISQFKNANIFLTNKSQKEKAKVVAFDHNKVYSFKFNCMRNDAVYPICCSEGIKYALYDIIQSGCQVYHTNLDSYTHVVEKYRTIIDKKQKNKMALIENRTELNPKDYNARHFQYTHFVIPLYKYPGNALMTIFIPLFLLSLLSQAIFFQPNDLTSRLGSIATMVLGYVSLISSVKGQLPPSSRLTIIQIVIYVQTLCCLLSLIESLLINSAADYEFHWYKNPLFLICSVITGGLFLFMMGMMVTHKLVWEPRYNKKLSDKYTQMPDPEQEPQGWTNLYCDEQFYQTCKVALLSNAHKSTPKDNIPVISTYIPTYEPQKIEEPIKPAAKQVKIQVKKQAQPNFFMKWWNYLFK